MNDEDNKPTETDTDAGTIRLPEDAFAALGNPLRIDILYALWETHDPPGSTPLSFSQLQDRAGAPDSGNFNYHLNTLIGTFVERTDEGYALHETGQKVVRSILAGTNTENPTVGPVAIDEVCPMCGATLSLSYHDGAVRLRCPDCVGLFPGGEYPRGTISVWPLSPAGVRYRTLEEVFDAALTRLVVNTWSMIAGVCPACSGVPELSIDSCEDHDPDENGICTNCGNPTRTATNYICENCKYYIQTGPWGHALFHPTVIAFLYNHGINADLTSREYHERAFQCGEEIVSSDPLRIEVTVPAGDDELCVTLDEEMTVVEAIKLPSY